MNRVPLELPSRIVAVALGSVADEPLLTKALVLSLVSAGMTVGIYGLVALIVKLDDIGLYLQTAPRAARATGPAGSSSTPRPS